MIWFQTLPNAVEDEEELDEDAAEGQDAAHDDARHRFGEEWLLRNLAWDLVCSHRWLNALLKQENKNTHIHDIVHDSVPKEKLTQMGTAIAADSNV